jgi:hypothetical protein
VYSTGPVAGSLRGEGGQVKDQRPKNQGAARNTEARVAFLWIRLLVAAKMRISTTWESVSSLTEIMAVKCSVARKTLVLRRYPSPYARLSHLRYSGLMVSSGRRLARFFNTLYQ